ncbi:GNAT family N-acetyltransferase [Micromonospora sp. WMMD1076]|uniref:GNAT family N-acetyltransferase n=1 Tax=Micromonospora sp. WMMD1076 TaxID=3016103 RepID=UPI00249BFF53|nr:GNAT family N-acetyltransferase [Micromonospora sp. WMMD1076]WFF08773.1 GNAT family N-acetyltransferase [Micromonospora sp. WMMD1076]
MGENLRLRRRTAAEAEGLVNQLVDVYLDAHADDGPRYTAERYERQLAAHMPRERWELVTARVDDKLVGYVYGFPLGADTRWWDGIQEPVLDGFTDENGRRTFAVCELLVRRSWQRQGIARALHDRLLSTRREERATLLVRPDNAAAQQAYDSWGWRPAGWLQPTREGAPLFQVRTKELTSSS